MCAIFMHCIRTGCRQELPHKPGKIAAAKSHSLLVARPKRSKLRADEIHRELDRLCEGAPELDCQAVLNDLRQ